MPPMKRTIIQLPEEVFLQLSDLAAKETRETKRTVSIAELCRRAIENYLKEASPMKNNQMTAREFLAHVGVEDSEANLFALTRYTDSTIDFAQFPDAAVSDGLVLDADEPANFQEYLDRNAPMKKVYSEYFDNEYTLSNLESNGTVTHKGNALYLLSQARVCESNNEWYADKYEADAIDADGNAYRVYWQTTEEWDEACEYANLETYIAQCKRQHEEVSQEDMDRFALLDAKTLPDVNDESNACNWDKPHTIEELKF